jgi:hypothetical protein
MTIAVEKLMNTVRPLGQEEGRRETSRVFYADTLRWVAGGEVNWCACDECWAQLPFWRYVTQVRDAWRRRYPGGSRVELARYVWRLMSAGRLQLALRRFTEPVAVHAVQALRSEGEQGHWNLGELYEIVMRGLAHRGID